MAEHVGVSARTIRKGMDVKRMLATGGRILARFCYQKVVRSTCMHGGSGRAGVHGGPQLQYSSHDPQERLQRGRKLAGFCYIAIVEV